MEVAVVVLAPLKKNNPLNKLNHWPDLVPQGTDCKGHGLHQVLKVKKHWTAVAGGVCSCSSPFSPPTRPGRSSNQDNSYATAQQQMHDLWFESASHPWADLGICLQDPRSRRIHLPESQRMHNVWLESPSHPSEMYSCTGVSVACGRRHLRVTTDPSSRIATNAQRVAWICFTPLWDVFVHRRCLWTKTSQSHDGSMFQNRNKCTTCGLNLLHTPLRCIRAQALPVDEDISESRRIHLPESQQMHNAWLESASHPSEMYSCTGVACGRRHLRVTTDPSSRIATNAQRVTWICFTPLWDVFVHRRCLWTKTSQSHDGSIFQNRNKCTTCGLNLLHTPLRCICTQALPVDDDISESRRIHLPESQQMHNVWLESASHPSEMYLYTGVACGRRHLRVTTFQVSAQGIFTPEDIRRWLLRSKSRSHPSRNWIS